MHSGKDTASGGGRPSQVIGEGLIGLPGVSQIGVAALFGKGADIEPVQQFQIHPQSPEGVLGGVDVEIGETGNDQLSGTVDEGKTGIPVGENREGSGAAAVHADEEAARYSPQVLGVPAVTQISVQNK